jgi:hypothetical protein
MNGTRYRAVFTNKAGHAASTPATLTVTINPAIPTTIPTTPTTTPPPPAPAGTTPSTNWSGYVAQGDVFSSISASWQVSPAQCSFLDTYSSTWIGIDGATTPNVEQTGTATSCASGQPSYGAWYEMYGDTSPACNCYSMVPLDPSLYPVSPGDTINANIDFSSGVWTLSLADPASGWTFRIHIADPSPAPARSSAEWIVERPSLCLDNACSFTYLSYLTPMSPITFTNAAATGAGTSGSIAAFGYLPIEMVNGFSVLTTPSALSPDGSSFTVSE